MLNFDNDESLASYLDIVLPHMREKWKFTEEKEARITALLMDHNVINAVWKQYNLNLEKLENFFFFLDSYYEEMETKKLLSRETLLIMIDVDDMIMTNILHNIAQLPQKNDGEFFLYLLIFFKENNTRIDNNLENTRKLKKIHSSSTLSSHHTHLIFSDPELLTLLYDAFELKKINSIFFLLKQKEEVLFEGENTTLINKEAIKDIIRDYDFLENKSSAKRKNEYFPGNKDEKFQKISTEVGGLSIKEPRPGASYFLQKLDKYAKDKEVLEERRLAKLLGIRKTTFILNTWREKHQLDEAFQKKLEWLQDTMQIDVFCDLVKKYQNNDAWLAQLIMAEETEEYPKEVIEVMGVYKAREIAAESFILNCMTILNDSHSQLLELGVIQQVDIHAAYTTWNMVGGKEEDFIYKLKWIDELFHVENVRKIILDAFLENHVIFDILDALFFFSMPQKTMLLIIFDHFEKLNVYGTNTSQEILLSALQEPLNFIKNYKLENALIENLSTTFNAATFFNSTNTSQPKPNKNNDGLWKDWYDDSVIMPILKRVNRNLQEKNENGLKFYTETYFNLDPADRIELEQLDLIDQLDAIVQSAKTDEFEDLEDLEGYQALKLIIKNAVNGLFNDPAVKVGGFVSYNHAHLISIYLDRSDASSPKLYWMDPRGAAPTEKMVNILLSILNATVFVNSLIKPLLLKDVIHQKTVLQPAYDQRNCGVWVGVIAEYVAAGNSLPILENVFDIEKERRRYAILTENYMKEEMSLRELKEPLKFHKP